MTSLKGVGIKQCWRQKGHLRDRKLRPPGDVYVQSLFLPSGRRLTVFIHP